MQINNKKAESLVGVIVATVLLAILSLFLSSSFMSRKKTIITAGHRAEAKNFARAKIEEFAAENYSAIPAGVLSAEFEQFDNDRFATLQPTVTVVNDPHLTGFTYKKVVVGVTWNED